MCHSEGNSEFHCVPNQSANVERRKTSSNLELQNKSTMGRKNVTAKEVKIMPLGVRLLLPFWEKEKKAFFL